MIVVLLFLAVPWVCLQFVIVVFLDHTHFFRGVRPPNMRLNLEIMDAKFIMIIYKKKKKLWHLYG